MALTSVLFGASIALTRTALAIAAAHCCLGRFAIACTAKRSASPGLAPPDQLIFFKELYNEASAKRTASPRAKML